MKKVTSVFAALAGFHDWAPDLVDSDVEPYLCDPSSSEDVERWYYQIIFPSLHRADTSSSDCINRYLNLVENEKFNALLAEEMTNLSPVPFTQDKKLQISFFRQVAELLKKGQSTA